MPHAWVGGRYQATFCSRNSNKYPGYAVSPHFKSCFLSFLTFAHAQIIWFSAMFPYAVLTILFVKAVTLEGAWDGIKFLFTPDWDRLTASECWIDGGTQIFYSYGVGIGALLALGSYNKFNHNCYRYTKTCRGWQNEHPLTSFLMPRNQ